MYTDLRLGFAHQLRCSVPAMQKTQHYRSLAPSLWSRPVAALRSLNFLLTFRGALILGFIAILISGPVRSEHDIIASIFAYSFLAVIAVCLIFTVAQGIRLRRSLRVSLHSPAEGGAAEAVTSGTVTRFLLRTSPVRIAPFFVLNIEPEFEHPGVKPSLHRLSGALPGDRFLNEFIAFPHRGEWNIIRIWASLGDQFGFTQLRWEMDPNPAQVFRVEPPMVSHSALPIISSCQRSGDLVVATHDRLGDPFDLKAYHPSDGLRKVVWKIFARTGELIARHPEHTMTPEGQVIVYGFVRTDDDYVCSAILSYLNQLYELDLELFFGCDGMQSLTPARSVDSAKDLLVETAWHEGHDLDDVRSLLDYCGGALPDSHIERIVIFAPREAVSDAEASTRLAQIAQFLEARGIAPVFYLIARSGTVTQRISHSVESSTEIGRTLESWFLGRQNPASEPSANLQPSPFLDMCTKKNWEVVA